ncbi:MAG: hypothetical protein IJQ01_08345 [Selenomonadaceae bacterium]|nr:hypothetical protein [Selenomonadaceae bacterium]MBR0103490.1 hypothetical protein [Selenomonadaceae bacterium]
MRALKVIGLALLMIFVVQGRTSAEMPEISADETYFDVFKGAYVLKGNVHVSVDNHGFRAIVTADEGLVSVVKQKCWATGNVKLTQDDITFSCERAYMQWQMKTATVTGKIAFENKKSVAITSDTAVFNWQDKIVDFYGKVKLNGQDYQHVKYNVVEDKILARDKTFNAPKIVIPSAEE